MVSVFAAAPTPVASIGECLTLGDSPTLSETGGRPFVAPRGRWHRQLSAAPVNSCDLAEIELVATPACHQRKESRGEGKRGGGKHWGEKVWETNKREGVGVRVWGLRFGV